MSDSNLHTFFHQGRRIYDWDQNLSEVNLYVRVPEGIKGAQLYVELTATHLRIGLRPNPPYLEVVLGLQKGSRSAQRGQAAKN